MTRTALVSCAVGFVLALLVPPSWLIGLALFVAVVVGGLALRIFLKAL